jgi:hypothetical protein
MRKTITICLLIVTSNATNVQEKNREEAKKLEKEKALKYTTPNKKTIDAKKKAKKIQNKTNNKLNQTL